MTYDRKKVLVTVKAYPEKSKKYGACVCTAGITDSGEMIRLYPIPFENFSGKNNIPKYSWISVECEKAKELLNRKESYHIRYKTIKILGHVGTGRDRSWSDRNKIILSLSSGSLEELQKCADIDRTSLGLIKPREITDLTIDDKDGINKEESEMIKEFQMTLEGERRKELENIEYNFRYHFLCSNPDCKGHKIMCEDWEMLESWRKYKVMYPTREIAIEKFRDKFFNDMVKKDLYFFVGTHSKYNTWLIIGLYYPPVKQVVPGKIL